MRTRTTPRIISQARIETEAPDKLVVASGSFARLGVAGGIALLVLLGVINSAIWWQNSSDVVLALGMGATCLLPALILAFVGAVLVKLTLDARQKTLTLHREYLVGAGPWPRRREQTVAFPQIIQVEHRTAFGGRANTVAVGTDTGLNIQLQFGARRDEAARVAGRIRALLGTEAAPTVHSPEAAQALATSLTYSLMLRQIRSWAIWLLLIGVGQMVAAQSFSPWGALLIGVGLASFYFNEAAMFVIYGVTIGWAGYSNLLYGEIFWKGFALLQAFWTYQLFRQFFRFYRAQTAAERQPATAPSEQATAAPGRAERVFPWAGLALGLLGFLGLATVLVIAFVGPLFFNLQPYAQALSYAENSAVLSGILGFALSLASLLSGYSARPAAWIGAVTGAITMLTEAGLGLVFSFF